MSTTDTSAVVDFRDVGPEKKAWTTDLSHFGPFSIMIDVCEKMGPSIDPMALEIDLHDGKGTILIGGEVAGTCLVRNWSKFAVTSEKKFGPLGVTVEEVMEAMIAYGKEGADVFLDDMSVEEMKDFRSQFQRMGEAILCKRVGVEDKSEITGAHMFRARMEWGKDFFDAALRCLGQDHRERIEAEIEARRKGGPAR